MMKKNALILLIALLLVFIDAASYKAYGYKDPGNKGCKWKQITNWYGGVEYEACLKNGDGNSCICGNVTR